MVIVPALNEEDSIARVILDGRETLGADVVVIDDGSSDLTGVRAKAAGASVVTLPYNLGVGGAIRTGLRFAADRGYSVVVQLDGDGQHLAVEAKSLLDRLERGDVDIVVGSRFAVGYEVGGARRLMMRVLSRLISRRLATSVTDTTSGFRAMGPRAVKLFAKEYPVEYLSDTVEALLLAGDYGLRVAEVDVRMRHRESGASTATSRSLYHLVRLLLVVLLHFIRAKPTRLAEPIAEEKP